MLDNALNVAKRLNDWNIWNGHQYSLAIGTTGTLERLERAALELLEPLEPYLSDSVLNGAKRLNDLNSSEYACWLMPRAYYLFDDITRR
jgi:hypothetical protein